ncbi:transposase family protein [Streptomyces flavidovirens]|uniref:transposase family protein n=1 Tax=Streptomyces flavidovirens TaxID=67298 RepID=UPI003F53F833
MHIPRGYWHTATRLGSGEGGRSLRVTFGFTKRTGVTWANSLSDAARADQAFCYDLDGAEGTAHSADGQAQRSGHWLQPRAVPGRTEVLYPARTPHASCGRLWPTGWSRGRHIADLGFVGLDDSDPDADPAVVTGYKAARNRSLTRGQKLANRVLVAVRAPVEHGFAHLKNWRALGKVRTDPRCATAQVRALLVLTNREVSR